MDIIKDTDFTDERSLFQGKNLQIDNCTFQIGESPLKESENIDIKNSCFKYKYPLWYSKNITVESSVFETMARSGIWYTENVKVSDCTVKAPKLFRRCKRVSVQNLTLEDAKETLYFCEKVNLENIVDNNGDYFGMNSRSVKAKNIIINGNYCFDGGDNISVKDSIINSKDAFWNCENVYLENCKIDGEFFGWNSKNIYLKNCEISSHQGFCYMENIKLENCTITGGDLLFEYCKNIDAEVLSALESVKNPISGTIRSKGIVSLILDDKDINQNKLKFIKI